MVNKWWVRPRSGLDRRSLAGAGAQLPMPLVGHTAALDFDRGSWRPQRLGSLGRASSPRNFSSTSGHGLINTAAAIARLTGLSPNANGDPISSGAVGTTDWNLSAIGSPQSWAQGFRGQGQVVAVIDTGVDLTHPDLRGNLWRNRNEIAGNGIDDDGNGFVDDRQGWDFVRNRARPQDRSGHGTHVAGIIAAKDNGIGSTGVAPRAKIMPIRVLGRNGTNGATLARGIRYAVHNGADVINLSLGSIPGTGVSPVVKRSLRLARRSGVSMAIAAGNERLSFGATRAGEPAFWAATHRLGIAVGAVDRDNDMADFSNPTGNRRFNWFVVAPGVDIASTFRGGRTALLSGTSMATPHVAGAIALLRSADPRATPGQIARSLIGTASPIVGA
ncbi:MAG: S8 family peptidase [Elainellaceae cyanobacterium]